MIEVRAIASVRLGDARRQQRDAKAQMRQKAGKKAVEFVAETAASTDDNLVVKPSLFKADRLFIVDRQIFEGNRQEMSLVQISQQRQ